MPYYTHSTVTFPHFPDFEKKIQKKPKFSSFWKIIILFALYGKFYIV